MNKFGFVVPVYNVKEEYLRACVESLKYQSCTDIRIILVDDCSENDCRLLCDELAESDSRIRVIHQNENRGVSSARNTGLLACDSEWVAFIDADDWVEKDTCRTVLSCIERYSYEIDIIMFSGYVDYMTKERIVREDKEPIIYLRDSGDIDMLQISALSHPLKGTLSSTISIEQITTKFFRKRFLIENDLHMPLIPCREDGLFFQYCLEAADVVLRIPDRLYHYRVHEDNTITRYRENAPAEQKRYLEMLWEFAAAHNKDLSYREAMYVAAFLSMQIVIYSYFFNPQNPKSYPQRIKECEAYFSLPPYDEVMDHIRISRLKRHHTIKAICIKLRWYQGVSTLRRIYLRLTTGT